MYSIFDAKLSGHPLLASCHSLLTPYLDLAFYPSSDALPTNDPSLATTTEIQCPVNKSPAP